MNKHCGAVLGILIVFAWSGLAAGKEMRTCALLTSSEIVAAVGGTGESQESNIVILEGPPKGETMGGCMWTADNQGMVSISLIRAPQARYAKRG